MRASSRPLDYATSADRPKLYVTTHYSNPLLIVWGARGSCDLRSLTSPQDALLVFSRDSWRYQQSSILKYPRHANPELQLVSEGRSEHSDEVCRCFSLWLSELMFPNEKVWLRWHRPFFISYTTMVKKGSEAGRRRAPPASRGAAPKPRASGKAKSKAKAALPEVHLRGPGHLVATPALEDTAASPRRPLKRWSTDDTVERIVKTKLSAFDVDEVAHATGSTSGLTVREYIRRELHSERAQGTYLAGEFWLEFHSEFFLTASRFRDLKSADDPPELQEVPDQLLEALALAKDKNPVARRTDAVVNYLKYVPDLNLTSLKLTFMHSRAGSQMTLKHANSQVVALLQFASKKMLWQRFPSFWERVRQDVDEVFALHVQKSVVKGSTRPEWVRGNTAVLASILDIDSVHLVEGALGRNEPPPVGPMTKVLESATGMVLYSEQALDLRYRQFLLRIDESVRQLEEHHFDPTDWDNFETVMHQDIG